MQELTNIFKKMLDKNWLGYDFIRQEVGPYILLINKKDRLYRFSLSRDNMVVTHVCLQRNTSVFSPK